MSSPNLGADSATAFFTSNSGVYGTINFNQPLTSPVSPAVITGDINALPSGSHALTINTNGDISQGGLATGPVLIELQPIEAKDGIAHVDQTSDKISVRAIIGRSVVVYAKSYPDGDPIAWGVIGLLQRK